METPQVKVVLLGDSCVGKSSILYRFITGTFHDDIEPTIGANFMSKIIRIGETSIKLNIWDTAGQERYNSFVRMYCRDAKAVIFVFDSNNLGSFDGMSKWNDLVKESSVDEKASVYIVANKSDMYTFTEYPANIKDFAKEVKANIYQVSAKTNQGINELFSTIAEEAVFQKKRESGVVLANGKEAKKKGQGKKKKCC